MGCFCLATAFLWGTAPSPPSILVKVIPLHGSEGELVTQASAAVGCTEMAAGEPPHMYSTCVHISLRAHVYALFLGFPQGPLCVPGYGHTDWLPCPGFFSIPMLLHPNTPQPVLVEPDLTELPLTWFCIWSLITQLGN